ncbi:MAG: sterol desaturase family protein [Bacteroidia bacterium]|nr:sterol desaturase family protein [Bacteroidia bacterium]
MKEFRISNSGSGRLFKSGLLEKLTRTNFLFPVIFYYAASAGCLIYAHYSLNQVSWFNWLLVPCGMLMFTLVEYLLHRFVFHFRAETPKEQKLKYTIHGVHHAFPKDKDRLVMPPVISIGVASLFWILFYLFTGDYVWYLFSGFLAGYSTYLIIHYSVHRYRQPRNFLKVLWRHHSLHHYYSDEVAFSVSFPVWDWIFGTLPTRKSKELLKESGKLPDR